VNTGVYKLQLHLVCKENRCW